MNSAQSYKAAFTRKRTYFIPLTIAVVYSMLFSWLGAEVELYHEEENMEALMAQQNADEIEQKQAKVPVQLTPQQQRRFENIPYEAHFRQYAPEIHWPWELLAAVAYHESQFKPDAVSNRGARGLMQLMPRACERYGLDDSTVFIPQHNIEAAVQCIASIQRNYTEISDSIEQIKFVLASYNAGPAHVQDAQRLAVKHGGDPLVWQETEEYFQKLSDKDFYRDSVVQYGYYNSKHAVKYVHGIFNTYEQIVAAQNKEQ